MQNDCDECSNQDSENAKTSLLSCLHKNSAGKPSKIKGFRRFFIFTEKEKNREIHGFSLANSPSANGSMRSLTGCWLRKNKPMQNIVR